MVRAYVRNSPSTESAVSEKTFGAFFHVPVDLAISIGRPEVLRVPIRSLVPSEVAGLVKLFWGSVFRFHELLNA